VLVEEEPGRERVATAIVEYLSHHPEAADTAEGIRQFWFRDSRMNPGQVSVQAALDELVRREVVVAWTSAARQKIYGSAKRSRR
jgi:hypothetical protein